MAAISLYIAKIVQLFVIFTVDIIPGVSAVRCFVTPYYSSIRDVTHTKEYDLLNSPVPKPYYNVLTITAL